MMVQGILFPVFVLVGLTFLLLFSTTASRRSWYFALKILLVL